MKYHAHLILFVISNCVGLQLIWPPHISAQKSCAAAATTATRVGSSNPELAGAARDREIAAQFAPVFQQGLGDKKRQDYITNFDFDGDWRGDNNWDNADDPRFARRAYVYYAVSETPTHYFIHYALFHPRDYKGGEGRGAILSGLIREGVRRGGRYDPTGLSGEAVLAHENDMEGCLVVAAKSGAEIKQARVVFVETLAHDRFLKYVAETAMPLHNNGAFASVSLKEGRPELYVEPKGHGIVAFKGGELGKRNQKQMPSNGFLAYEFKGRADDADKTTSDEIGYELVPLYTTIWPRARGGVNQTFGAAFNFGTRSFSAAQTSNRATRRTVRLGTLGAAFRGNAGAPNMARPPWGWFDRKEKRQLQGEWFFGPAATIKRHFNPGGDFSLAYTHAPYLGVFRKP